MAERGTGPARQCVDREGCHPRDVRVWQSVLERRDHPQNAEEATLGTAKDLPYSSRNVHKPSSQEDVWDGGSGGTAKAYTGL